MLDICRDIEKYCPDAMFLNYTNPMAMLCGAMQKYSNVEVPVVADRMGIKTTIAGPLPEHLTILVNTTACIESLVV